MCLGYYFELFSCGWFNRVSIVFSIPLSLNVKNSLNSFRSSRSMFSSSDPFRLDSSLRAPPYNCPIIELFSLSIKLFFLRLAHICM